MVMRFRFSDSGDSRDHVRSPVRSSTRVIQAASDQPFLTRLIRCRRLSPRVAASRLNPGLSSRRRAAEDHQRQPRRPRVDPWAGICPSRDQLDLTDRLESSSVSGSTPGTAQGVEDSRPRGRICRFHPPALGGSRLHQKRTVAVLIEADIAGVDPEAGIQALVTKQ